MQHFVSTAFQAESQTPSRQDYDASLPCPPRRKILSRPPTWKDQLVPGGGHEKTDRLSRSASRAALPSTNDRQPDGRQNGFANNGSARVATRDSRPKPDTVCAYELLDTKNRPRTRFRLSIALLFYTRWIGSKVSALINRFFFFFFAASFVQINLLKCIF